MTMPGAVNGSPVLSPEFVALLRPEPRPEERQQEHPGSGSGGVAEPPQPAREPPPPRRRDHPEAGAAAEPGRPLSPQDPGTAAPGWLRANWARLVSGAALAAVAAVAGIISFDHIETLTLALHQAPVVARLMPFGVDGLIVVGSVVLLTAIPGTEWLGWLGVVPGVVASLFANVESGIRYGWLAATWAGVPAGSFALACFLLERWLKAQASRPAEVARGGRNGGGTGTGGDGVPVVVGQCPHGVAVTVDEAIVNAWLHGRDCLDETPSQRQLSAMFGQSRQKVAELVGPLSGSTPAAA